ncbi:uncharacterized protein LOC103513139 [Diaphorina citri]|uniref:Uncharacterized protein LOC103513139 n=1 Tax=Diaphorina citri TaxID=121845 RepID=A0A1S3D7N6_DIACI|nr:uncharacterized protein LOC103513139 [Diaphorina citri]
MDVVPLQPAQPSEPSAPLESSGPVPPRSARDYPASSDNYGWTYPSSVGATAAGSASYYPSAEYGKPSGGDSKYYSWAAPGDDKYKRPSYFTYQGGAPVECIPIPMAGIITEMTKGGGGTMDVKNSLIRNVLSALVALFVIKIPIMIALKALVFKLFILPASLLMIGLPVLMPLLYFFLPSFMKDKDKTTTAKPATMVMMMSNPNSTRATRRLYDDPIGGRTARTLFRPDGSVTDDFEDLLRTLIGEQSCVEKIACQFGVRDAQSQYRKPISWVLKYVQTLKPVLSDPALRTKLKLYREAYNFGADIAASNTTSAHDAQVVCSDTLYPCQKPQVIVKQARTLYKLF